MKYPKTLLIKDAEYAIKFVNRIKDERKRVVGLCDPEECCIYIKKGQTRKETFSTFIHEVLHAIEAEYDFDLTHRHVYKLEAGISSLILANFS